jgi:hypothetical protein
VHYTRSLTPPRRPVGNNAARNPCGGRRQTVSKYPRESMEGRRSKAATPPMHASRSRSKEEGRRERRIFRNERFPRKEDAR